MFRDFRLGNDTAVELVSFGDVEPALEFRQLCIGLCKRNEPAVHEADILVQFPCDVGPATQAVDSDRYFGGIAAGDPDPTPVAA